MNKMESNEIWNVIEILIVIILMKFLLIWFYNFVNEMNYVKMKLSMIEF